MPDPEHIPVEGEIVTLSPDRGLTQLANLVCQTMAAVQASSGYQEARKRSYFPAASVILYDDKEIPDQSSQTDAPQTKI